MELGFKNQHWDTLIKNAIVYDGTGNEPINADVAIKGKKIVAIGELSNEAGSIINAAGLALAPGFIDVHTHDDLAVLLQPGMDFKIMQGVTTVIVGNCGSSAAPHANALELNMMHPNNKLPNWNNYSEYMATLEQQPACVNIGVLVGHGTLRDAVMGNVNHKPTEKELARMCKLLEEGLSAGALGFSSGLIYEPGCYAKTDELITLAKLTQSVHGLYATHMRNEGDKLIDAVNETLQIGEESGISVQISHHKAAGRNNWGTVKQTLKLIDAARARGLNVTLDQYPYLAGSTMLSAVVNNGALSMHKGSGGLGRVSAADVILISKNKKYDGFSLAHFCEQWELDSEKAARKILAQSDPFVVIHLMCEEDVCTVMKHPCTMIGSDGVPATHGKPHPRLYGTFARVLGHYVRERKVLPLETAIHRMTGFPAEKFKLKDRGVIREQAYADLVLFDPEKIADTSSYENPRSYPTGIQAVFVNGSLVANDGVHKQNRPGHVLKMNEI